MGNQGLSQGLRDSIPWLQVIRECGLLEDLQRLPEGDLTWVKKNGDNLSGGQRQRISLARAVFKNAGIYLLDDPMSAIDPCLRVRIFDQVIGNKGLLRKKTRIIITKDQRFLHKLDYILVMKNQVRQILQSKYNGVFKSVFQTIFDSGTYEELVQRQSITAESIYGDEFDADPVVTLSDVESPSEGQNSNPESEDHTSAKDKRHQFLRQNSVLQYMRDQKSIDDDPVNILQKMQSVNGRHATRRRTSSISAACPNSSLLCKNL